MAFCGRILYFTALLENFDFWGLTLGCQAILCILLTKLLIGLPNSSGTSVCCPN
ncbi:hypothetical protein LguiB_013201 [Lonicera macranthoides]